MNISQWPLNKIMQLPDFCFGRRFSVIFSGEVETGLTGWFISELALPDKCILWELSLGARASTIDRPNPPMAASIKLGDQFTNAAAVFNLLDDLLPGLDEIDAGARVVRVPLHLTQLRLPIAAQGRRVAVRAINATAASIWFSLGLIFSSIPKEVPDWLVSV